MENGYFLLSRNIFDSKIWTEDHDVRSLWIWLIGNARHDRNPKKLANVIIKRGELVTSYANIAEDNQWHFNNQIKKWNKSQIHRMLNILMNDGYIEILDDTYGTHIKICNYDIYQNPQTYKKETDTIDNEDALNDNEIPLNNYNNNIYDNDNNEAMNDFGTAAEQLQNSCRTAAETYNNDNKDNNGKNDKNDLKDDQAIYDVHQDRYLLEDTNKFDKSFKESKSDSLKDTGNGKSKSKKQKAPPDSRVNDVYKFFVENHPIQPCIIVNIPRTKKEIKTVINAIDPVSDDTVSDIEKLLNQYFKSNDAWYIKRGYDFNTFMNNLNALKNNKSRMTPEERFQAWKKRNESNQKIGVN